MHDESIQPLLSRIDRLEATVARLADLLEQQAAGAVPQAARAAEAELTRADGAPAVTRRLADALVAIGEPDTLDALVRIANLSPQLEYALHFVAAGPELLEESLDVLRGEVGARDPAEMEKRVQAAKSAALALSEPRVVRVLTGLAQAAPDLEPAALGAARGLRALANVEGEDSVRDRVADAVVRLAEPETLEALLRLAELSPQLDWAARFAAAGPELLEESLDTVRGWSGDGPPLQARMEQGLEALEVLSRPRTLAALAGVAEKAPQLAELANLAADPERVAALGTLLELAVTMAEPGHADALRRLIEHAPQVVDALVVLPDQPETLRFLESANRAVAEGLHDRHERLGAWGLFRALQDPDVQLAAGFTIHVARHLGAHLTGSAQVPARAK